MIDKHTFGGTKASENLAQILNIEYPKLSHKVSRHYHKFSLMMKNLRNFQKICYSGDVLILMALYKKHTFDNVTQLSLPSKVESHLKNVMICQYRICYEHVKRSIKESRFGN